MHCNERCSSQMQVEYEHSTYTLVVGIYKYILNTHKNALWIVEQRVCWKRSCRVRVLNLLIEKPTQTIRQPLCRNDCILPQETPSANCTRVGTRSPKVTQRGTLTRHRTRESHKPKSI
jgi:hypothetical protein